MKLSEMNLTPEEKSRLLEELIAERVVMQVESLVMLMEITESMLNTINSISTLSPEQLVEALKRVKPELNELRKIINVEPTNEKGE